MGRLYLVRHGQASLLGDDYDRLSPTGEQQARAVGRWLAARAGRPVRLVSGTLQRQSGTLRLLAEAAGWDDAQRCIDADLDEYSQDDLLARAFPEFADRAALQARLRASDHPRREFQSLFDHGLRAWLRGDIALSDGLTWPRFRARCVDALRRVAAACGSGDSAVVVTSGGPIAAVCQDLLGVRDERLPLLHYALFNGSLTSLLTRGESIGLSVFNSVAHLELEPGVAALVTYR